MEVIKNVLVFAVCAIGLTIGIAFVLPRSWEASREIEIGIYPGDAHLVIGDLRGWTDWCPWGVFVDNGVDMKVGPSASGVGASLSWSGPEVGKGSLKIMTEDRRTGLTFALALDGRSDPIVGAVTYEQLDGAKTRVKLSLRGEVHSSAINRYSALWYSSSVDRDLGAALKRLKRRLE